MHFGYFLNQSNVGWKKSFTDVVNEGHEIAEYCDRTGWDSIWTTEHHFGHEGWDVCFNPVMMSTDLAARTKQIRIGQAAGGSRSASAGGCTHASRST
ncbi:MAG: alkanesulfonate monooxygenase SsuD [Candidatus Poriferisodalaceae bacterium]|jgi:alkanesulfonate monooxygenase SsuD/methylene tetrahydromethanopterin reductase-like flavin-dependent oxidoreductase (luciferase family)